MGKRGPVASNSRKADPEAAPEKRARSAYLSPTGRGLNPAERAEWNRRVRAKEPGFYREDDAGLLVQLCQAVVDRDQLRLQKIEAQAAKKTDLALQLQSQWRRQAQLISGLSRQLKIGASARETHRTAAKASKAGLPEAASPRAHLMFGGAKEEGPADRLN